MLRFDNLFHHHPFRRLFVIFRALASLPRSRMPFAFAVSHFESLGALRFVR